MKKFSLLLIKIIIILFTVQYASPGAEYFMRKNGPYGSNINKIMIDTITGDVYVATKTDGVYKSNNDGDQWNDFNLNTGDLSKKHEAVNDIAINKNNTLFAATDTLGIMKKAATGTWAAKPAGNNPPINAVYVLSNQEVLAGSTGYGVYKSSNEGDSWIQKTNGLGAVNDVYSIIAIANGTIIFIGTDKGIYKSINGGNDWTMPDANMSSVKVFCFAKTDDELSIMAGTDKGPYRTTNAGTTWNAQNSGMGVDKKVVSLAYSKIDGIFLAGTEKDGFYKCSISTYIWTPYNNGLESSNIHSIAVNNKGRIYAGTNFAFYELENLTSIWEPHNKGLGLRTVNGFASLASRGEVLAATDLGVYRTTDEGNTWEQLNNGLADNLDINALAFGRTGNLFAGTNGGGLYISTDLGKSWNVNSGITPSVITTLDTNSAGILFAGTSTQGVFKSDNTSGTSWTQMTGGDINNQNILSFVVGKDDYLYAGTDGNGLFKKTPTYDWQQVTNLGDVSATKILALAYLKDLGDGKLFAATNNGVKRTIDNGQNWNGTVTQGVTLNGAVTSIIVGDNGVVFVSTTNKAVYMDNTTKTGDTWANILGAINNYVVKNLDISGRGFIYAGTVGAGCYRSDTSTSGNILQIAMNPSDSIKAKPGEKVTVNLVVTNTSGSKEKDVKVIVKNDMDLSIPQPPLTNANGQTTFDINIKIDQPEARYLFTFIATRIDRIDSYVDSLFIDVEKQKVYLDVQPKKIVYADSGLPITYYISTKNKDGIDLPGITVFINDSLLKLPVITKITDSNGEATYNLTVPEMADGSYYVHFNAIDPSLNYFPSDSEHREIQYKHNAIQIYGEKDVCTGSTKTYKTNPGPGKSFVWNAIQNGTFVGPTNLDSVTITWGSSGYGEFTLVQTVNPGNIITPQTYPVTVYDLPVVTLNNFPAQGICANEPYTLIEGNHHPDGVYSGPGVKNGIFYGDSAGGAGSYPITYTYTSDTQPFCVSSDTKSIVVLAPPNVTLNLAKPVACLSDFPFLLTGGLVDGQDKGGDYSGPGVTDNIFDPISAGVDTFKIVFTYTDPGTGCTNTAEQDLIVNDAPSTSFIMPNTTICNSELALKLTKFTSEPGVFSSPDPGVNAVDSTFNAEQAGLGPHRLIFTTDNKIGNCPGVAFVDVTVVAAPAAPTIDWGPKPDRTYFESSSPTGNQWYRNGDSIIGATNQRIYPTLKGDYQVTYRDPNSPNCESKKSDTLNYETKDINVPVTPVLFDSLMEPGRDFELKLQVGNIGEIQSSMIDSISAEFVFNPTILYPLDGTTTPKGKVDFVNKLRRLPIEIQIDPLKLKEGDYIDTLFFKTMVGDAESSELIFNNLQAWRKRTKVQSNLKIDTSKVTILVNKTGGAARLYDLWGSPIITKMLFYPNPADESIILELISPVSMYLNIYISDLNGQKLEKIFEGESKADMQTMVINTDKLTPGVYYLIYQTPMQKQAQPLYIIR